MASQCQRSILSCARCRRRKIKCDRQLPACSQCIATKTVCTGIAAKVASPGSSAAARIDGSAVVPRSIVQHLESEVARLETALLQDGQLEVVHASDILLGMPGTTAPEAAGGSPDDVHMDGADDVAAIDPALQDAERAPLSPAGRARRVPPAVSDALAARRAAIVGSRSLQAIVSATLPYELGTAAGLLSRVRMGLTPSTAKVRERSGGSISAAATAVGGARSSTAKARPTSTVAAPSSAAVGTAAAAAGPSSVGAAAGAGAGVGVGAASVGGGGGQPRLPAPILRSIPWDIVQRLLRKYLTTIQPDNPFLVASTVVQQFQNVADVLAERPPTQEAASEAATASAATAAWPVPPSHDFLVVYLILAIAVTLSAANDGHEERCTALSVSLFEEGIQHLYGLPVFPSELAWLQTILLVLLYATVFPRAANVWVLSGVAMRSCLELGLHREQPHWALAGHGHEDSAEEADLRRRVFWAAYCMDRSICSALQRPLSTPDAAIDTCLPWPASALLSSSATAPPPPADPFLSCIAYNKLLSEVLHVHFHREPLPAPLTWDDWLASMEARLQAWHTSSQPLPPSPDGSGSGSSQKPNSSSRSSNNDFMLARGLMVLHRPSPRVPLPAAASLLRAFEAAAAAERIHRNQLRAAVFRRTWLSAHYTLEAAMVLLFCLRHGYAAISERFTPAQIFDRAKLPTSNLLAIAAHGWPEVGIYAGVYERLLGPLLERVFLRTPLLDPARFGAAEDAELMRLLYPGPAHLDSLRFGLRQKQPQPSPQADLSPFDFNLFMLDDEIWEHAGLLGPGGGDDNWMALQEMDFGMG